MKKIAGDSTGELATSNSLDTLFTENEIIKFYQFLALIPPDAQENPEKLKGIIQKLGGYLWYGRGYWEEQYGDYNKKVQSSIDPANGQKSIEKLTGLKNVRPLFALKLRQEYKKPILSDGTELDQRQEVVTLEGDSNVYLLEGRDCIMKIYFTLGKEEILAYHGFQNQLAQTEYDFDYDGQVKGEGFKKIHVRVLPLPEDGIIGTRYSSISFIPFSPFPNTIDIFENNSPIIAEIMRYIGKTNKLSHFPERLHPMNIQFVGINDGILSLVITDIGDVIQSTLESQGFYKEFARETPTLREKVIARVGGLFKIGR